MFPILNDSAIIPMVRSPRKGKVKKRLAADIGEDAALELYKCFVMDILDSLEGIRADIIIGYHPEEDRDAVIEWLGGDLHLIPQAGVDLGERQAHLLGQAFTRGYIKAAVMITDAPDIPAGYIDEAFSLLEDNDVVVGPCHDGGYYLIGFRKDMFRPAFFSEADWSGPLVKDMMTKRLKEAGLECADLDPWWDIDNMEDLLKFRDRVANCGSNCLSLNYLDDVGVLDGR
ncbi:MAG: TIGR04282 family arsenosugar biosynthesis glycosyltransferase [Thermoplasmatota archaeon]